MNAQFHLNTSVAPPWGSEVRLNSPPGGLDDPFLGSPGGQTNIFPVTFDQNAPFSLNGPFLSLSNDMESDHVDMWNVTVERQLARTWLASAGYVGSRTNNIWESTPLNNALFVPVNGAAPSAANTNARRPLTLADPANGQYYGPAGSVRDRRQAALQRHDAVGLGGARPYGVDAQRELRPVALLRFSGRRRRRHDQHWSWATTSPGIRALTMATARRIGCTTSR